MKIEGWSFSEKLKVAKSYDAVFELVKRAVGKTLRLHRAGLTLILAEIPNAIGAYHVLGSNAIVMNKTLLDVVRAKAESREEINSFIFTILAHEYLHSLGFVDEREVRRLVLQICVENLGKGHHATKVALGNFGELYPELKYLGPGKLGQGFEIIKEFDRSSTPYIG